MSGMTCMVFLLTVLIAVFNMNVFTGLKLDLERNVHSICCMIRYYIIILVGMRMHYERL